MDGMFLKIYPFHGMNPVAVLSVTQRNELPQFLPICFTFTSQGSPCDSCTEPCQITELGSQSAVA